MNAEEQRQLARLDQGMGQPMPQSPPIGGNMGVLARLTGTQYGGHSVPLHVLPAALEEIKRQQMIALVQGRHRRG